MTAAIHQPDYIPYPGYFYKILKSDIFVFLDDAQFSNNGGHDVNLIKAPEGPLRLKIPVRQTLGDTINKVRTKDELGWKSSHIDAIRRYYKKTPYFDTVFPVCQELLNVSYDNLAELNKAIILSFCHEFGLNRTFLNSSEMGISSKREQRIIDICHSLRADTYYSGNGARVYQSEEQFNNNGIRLVYSDYKPTVYPQLGDDFIENLSIVDFIMNCGFALKDLYI